MRQAILTAACAAVFLGGCSDGGRPNVLLVTLDSVRADRIGAAGHAAAKTPNLDALAAGGVLFSRAYASAAQTFPSHVSILAGADPPDTGVHVNGRPLAAPLSGLAPLLAEHDYATGAFVSALTLDSYFGLARGFVVYDDEIDDDHRPLAFVASSRRGAETTDRAVEWLGSLESGPFFAWVHYRDVHAPRAPPPPFDAMADAYDGELAYVDRELGRLLAAVRALDGGERTVVVVVGDHGESFGEHDEHGYGVLAYDSTLRVPLVLSVPDGPAGVRSPVFARTVDVLPTVLDAAGIDVPEGLRGRSLLALVGEDAPPYDAAADPAVGYFESAAPRHVMGWAGLGGVRTARWKYTAETEPVELYDVLDDPAESRNRVADSPEVVRQLDHLYRQLRPKHDDAPAGDGPVPSPDMEARLSALGYLVDSVRPAAVTPPDPRRHVATVALIDRARAHAARGNVPDAFAALGSVASSPVARPLALRSLARMYLHSGREDDALAAFRDLAALTGDVDARIGWARALSNSGDHDSALALLGATRTRSKAARVRIDIARARALLALGMNDEAERVASSLPAADGFSDVATSLTAAARAARDGAGPEIDRLRHVFERQPRAHLSFVRLLELLRSEGRDREVLELAAAVGPERLPTEAFRLLGAMADDAGDAVAASVGYERYLTSRPEDADVSLSLASAYRRGGREDDARRLFARAVALDPDLEVHRPEFEPRAAQPPPAPAVADGTVPPAPPQDAD